VARVKVVLRSDVSGCRTFITGFHGIGFVGSLAVDYLVYKLSASRVGYVMTNKMPPYVSLSGGRVLLPYELYRRGDLLLLRCNLPVSTAEMHTLTAGVARWVARSGLEEAVLIGGLDGRFRESESEKLRLAPTRRFLSQYPGKVRGKLLEEGLYIIGPLALLLAYFEALDFPALTVLPYVSVEGADPRAASVAIRYLNEVYGLEVDTAELEERGAEIEAELLERRRKLEEATRSSRLYYI